MIPEFNKEGCLPPGIHEASFEEVRDRFGFSKKRQALLRGMSLLLSQCGLLRCDVLYLDGSFVTAKVSPGDYDACWDTTCEDREEVLNKAADSLLNSDSETQKAYFGGEIHPAFSKAPLLPRLTIREYFQTTKEGGKKGIIKIKL